MTAVALLLGLSGLVVTGPPAQAADAPTVTPFTCSVPQIFVAQGVAATQLYSESYATTGAVFTPIGSPWVGNGISTRYNAIAYNAADNFLYAIALSQVGTTNSYDLLRVGADGAVQDLGPITGMPTDARFINNGSFFDGTYYIASYGTTDLYAVDLNTVSVTATTMSQSWGPSDFTQIGSYLWGVDSGTFSRLDPSTGQVDTFPNTVTSAVDAQAGAVFTFGNGNFGVSSSATGVVSQIAIANAATTPSFTLISQATGPASSRNDGASCLPSPSSTDLSIDKTGPATVGPDGTVAWQITVTNHGPAASSGFTMTDTMPAGVTAIGGTGAACQVANNTVTCTGTSPLMVGQSQVITVTGTAPGTDNTCFTNQAQVMANESDPTAGNDTSQSVQTCTEALPGLSVVKTADPASVGSVGDQVTYTFHVVNTGNVSLSGVGVDEGAFTGTGMLGAVSCPGTTLVVGASMDCTASYAVTQADLDAGTVSNTATAHGTPPGGATPVDAPPSTVTVTVAPDPGLSVSKTVSPTSVNAVGDQVTYTFHVVNTGNVSLSGVGVDEGAFTGTGMLGAVSCPGTTLVVGASMDCTASYAVTQADLDAGTVSNTATAHGTPPGGATPVDSPPSTTTVTVPAAPGLAVVKTASVDRLPAAGAAMVYTFHVTNTGNVTMSHVVVMDSDFSGTGALGAITCPASSLASGASMDCTASYTVTAADVAAGKLTNSAAVTGIPPGADAPISPSEMSTVTVPVISDAVAVVDTGAPAGTSHHELVWIGLLLMLAAGGTAARVRRNRQRGERSVA